MTLTDHKSTIQAAKAGSEPAFADLVAVFAPRVHRFLVATGLRGHDADDIVQETFIRLHRHLSGYDERRSFTTWLFTIAHRLRLNLVTRRHDHAPLDSIPAPATDLQPELHEPDPQGVWAVARRVLDDRQYRALWLRYGEDLGLDEVGRVIGITALHARVLLHRARSKLAPHLAGIAGLATTTSEALP